MSAVSQLPDECWELVFRFLSQCNNHHSLEPLSLVSNQFLSITNRLRFSLTICDPTLPYLPHLFTRFPTLTSLDLTRFRGDLHALLHQISLSPLTLDSLNISNHTTIPENGLRSLGKKMKTLKSLTCSNMGSLTNSDLLLIADSFPFLEELDVSFPRDLDKIFIIDIKLDNMAGPISDLGVKALSLTLPKLRKVNLSGNYFINNSSLLNLCKNCEFLEEVVIFGCDFITQEGIASAIKTRPNLTSFSVSNFGRPNISSDFIASLVSLKNLTCIDLSYSFISNELLFSVAEASLPLRKLVLQGSCNYSYAGISCLLSKCKLVQHLDLQDSEFLEDEHIRELSVFLGNLMYIYLSGCRMLTNLSFFALTKNCPLLSEITMEETSIGENGVEDSSMDLAVNSRMQSLRLAHNPRLTDESIEMFASVCPNLQLLDLSSCRGISKGVVGVLNRCCKITYLGLNSCLGMKIFGMNFEVPKLKLLNLSRSGVDDDALSLISKSCCGLQYLDMENCSEITGKGVKKVIENCKQLREINLKGCHKVAADVVAWMVFSRPSLRKIFTPPSFRVSESQRELFLRHGCLLS